MMQSATPELSGSRRGRHDFWWPLLAYFLLFGAWALAMPYGSYPDESVQIYNAYGVAGGNLAPPLATNESGWPGVYREVPRSLVVDPGCYIFNSAITADCMKTPAGNDRTPVQEFVYVGRYSPVYYLAVGAPLRILPNAAGILLARLIGAAIVAVFFAWATAVALQRRRRGVVVGILVALTPLEAHLAGAVNPSATEIAAGLALAVALGTLVTDPQSVSRNRTWWLMAVSGATLLAVRPTGPVMAAVIVCAVLAPLALRLRHGVPMDRRIWLTGGVWAVVGLLATGWTLWRHSTAVIPLSVPASHVDFIAAMKIQVFDRWSQIIPQFIGVLGWLDTSLPFFVHAAWWLCIGVVVMLAVATGTWTDRWRVLSLVFLGMLVPSVLEAIRLNKYGYVNQGRYFLPMLIGVPFLAASAVAADRYGDILDRLTRICVCILAPLQVFVLDWTMMRYQTGLPDLQTDPVFNPLTGKWHPAVGSVTPLLMAGGAAVLLVVFHWRATARAGLDGIAELPAGEPDAAPTQSPTDPYVPWVSVTP